MNRRLWVVLFVAAAVLSLAEPPRASGQNPFYYYPAYGAHRGKIVYRDGPLVNKQKIRWGNGLTPYGADVLNNAIGAAVQILPAILREDPAAEEDRARSQAEFSRSMADEELRLQQAQQLNARTQSLAVSFGLSAAPAASVGGNSGSFGDWDNSGAANPNLANPGNEPPTQPMTPGTAPVPGNLQDWDNSGNAPVAPAQGGAAGLSDWDNR
jgi:hypothetical protein